MAACRLYPPATPTARASEADVPKADVLMADALCLPMRPGSCDAVLCIAVLHHISAEARRVRLLRELVRVAAVGGRVLVQAWALEQGPDSRRQLFWNRVTERSRFSA